jgi:hypothetical protein
MTVAERNASAAWEGRSGSDKHVYVPFYQVFRVGSVWVSVLAIWIDYGAIWGKSGSMLQRPNMGQDCACLPYVVRLDDAGVFFVRHQPCSGLQWLLLIMNEQ